jgi:hypothetical protein
MTTDHHPRWIRSSYSGGQGQCVEVAVRPSAPAAVLVRDSKHGDTGPVLTLSTRAFATFTTTA